MTAKIDNPDPLACVPAVAVARSPHRRDPPRFVDFFGNDLEHLRALPLRARIEALAKAADEWDEYSNAAVAAAPRNAFGELVIAPGTEWKGVTLPLAQVQAIRAAAGKPRAYAGVAWRTEYKGWLLLCSPKEGMASGRVLAIAKLIDIGPMTPQMASILSASRDWMIWTFTDIIAVEPYPVRGSVGIWHYAAPTE